MSNEQISEVLVEGFADALRQRAEAKQLEERAAKLKAEANETIAMFFAATGSEEGTVPGLGCAKVVMTIRKKLDSKMFRELLVRAGLTAEKVAACETAATTEQPSTSINFYPEKPQKGAAD